MSTNSSVKPWARGPFELLQHAEEHRRGKRDFDRRVALIGFDNAIESSVITYLSLNPLQRGGRNFQRVDVDRWLSNFHTKVAFLEHFAGSLQQIMPLDPAEFIFYHQLRNELYHNGNGMVPAAEHINGARQAALWTFSTLFECDADALLNAKQDSNAPEVIEPVLSASTAFLQSFIETKAELDELLASMNKNVNRQIGIERLLNLLQESEHIPDDVVKATLQAARAKELVVRGDDTVVDEKALEALATELGTATDYFRKRLRSYQHDIVEAAIGSTVGALHGDGRAGVVLQAPGTGLTMTVLAYLARCRETNELCQLPIVVLADRREVCEQLAERARDLPEHRDRISTLVPNSAVVLNEAFRAPQSHSIVVTTWQQLRTIRADAGFESSCLIVCLNFAQIGTPDLDLRSKFPRGTFILFGSGPVRDDKTRLGLFGYLIRKYDYPAAVLDGSLLPVRIEQRSGVIGTEDLALRPHGVGAQRDLTAMQMHAISLDVVRDFDGKTGMEIHRSLIVARSRDSVAALFNELNRLSRERRERLPANDLAVGLLEAGATAFDVDRASPIIWVSTVAQLVGIDLGPAVRCYVTCKVSEDAQLRLVSIVARPRKDEQEALIVDYAENRWQVLMPGA